MKEITAPQLEALTGLTARRIQQLASTGKIPAAKAGLWPMVEVIKALFGYYRTLREPDELDAARLEKIQTETSLLKSQLAEREKEVVNTADMLEVMARGLGAMRACILSMSELSADQRDKVILQLREAGELVADSFSKTPNENQNPNSKEKRKSASSSNKRPKPVACDPEPNL